MSVLRLKELLKEKGVTGASLCEQTGLSQTSLSRIIKGDQNPRFELLLQIASVLNVHIRELFVADNKHEVNGFVEYDNTIYKIESKKDLEDILTRM